jgi:FMN-dependent oxidoreductase (nitrilotriacetate monooxygenase family)
MSTKKRQVTLGFSIWPTGRWGSAWRLPEAFNGGTVDPWFLSDTIRAAERGKFDYYFIGNNINSNPSSALSNGNEVFKIEGFTLGGYAAAITSNIGIVVTINSTYSDPYNTARAIVSLDHLSRGRAALNIVTGFEGSPAAGNFSRDQHSTTDDKYDWASELVQVVHELSDSWEDGWLLDDKAGGRFLDPAKGHEINHTGTHFAVRGPLNVPRPPQGHVPIIHAGTSERSFEFGAEFADIRFSPYRSPEWNQNYYRDIKGRLDKYGRAPDDQRIVNGVTFFVGATEREARDKFREVQALIVSEYAPQQLSTFFGVDLAGVRQTERVRDVIDLLSIPDRAWAVQSAFDAYGDEDITLLDLFHFVANNPTNQPPVVGSGPQVAEWIEENFENRAFDGVKVFPPYSRAPLDAFVDLVVPELQHKGIFRTEYETSTFRGHLGLDVPENPFAREGRHG